MELCEWNGMGQILLVFGHSIPLFCHFLHSLKATICNQSGKQERGLPTLYLGG